MQQVGNFGVAQLLKFTQEKNFAIGGFELRDGSAYPDASFGPILFRGAGRGLRAAEEGGAKDRFATLRSQDF
jgi:hypothetical protein